MKELQKIVLALGNALLITRRFYTCKDKLKILELCSSSSELAKNIYPLYEKAVDFRNRPQRAKEEKDIEILYKKVEQLYKEMYLELFSLYFGEKIKSFSHLAKEIFKNPVRDYRTSSQVKNLILNVSYFGANTVFSKWGYAHPINRLYAVLPFFLFNLETTNSFLKFIDDALMYKPHKGSIEKDIMADKKRVKKVFSIWSRFN